MPRIQSFKNGFKKDTESLSDRETNSVDLSGLCPNESFDSEAFVMNVADEIQAGIIISKLSTFSIPVVKKYKGSGSFMAVYMGNTTFGIDLFVPPKLLSLSKKVLNQIEKSDLDDEIRFDSLLNDYGFEDMDLIEFDECLNQNLDKINSDEATIKADMISKYIYPLKYKNHIDEYCSINEMSASKYSLSYFYNKFFLNRKKIIAIAISLLIIPIVFITIISMIRLYR